MTFTYLFDPLCGWCYAAAPAIQALRDANLGNIAMAPVGLFYQPRPTTAIAEHAKKNDTRIQALTQQPFSPAYFEQVLGNTEGVFSSKALTRAIVLLESTHLGLGGHFLSTAQQRRYVDGIDTSEPEAVAEIVAEVANAQGVDLSTAQSLAALEQDNDLHTRTDQMVQHASGLLGQMQSKGVPQLVMTHQGQSFVFSGADLYQGAEGFLQLLHAIKEATQMS